MSLSSQVMWVKNERKAMENVGPTSSLSFLVRTLLVMEFSKVLSRNWLMLDPSKMLSILVEQWKLSR